MITIGLTGSVGMGKSTTASMFKDAGAYVFDADAAVHKLYAKNGAAVPLLGAVFPDIIVDGAVERAKLLTHLKSDPLNIEVLESFIHPMVVSMREQALERAKKDGAKLFVADIPLLFETGAEANFDIIVVASANASVQRQRVLSRPGMTKQKFKLILSRQLPDAQKRAKADYVVETDKGMDFARNQVNTIVQNLLKR